MGCARNDDVNAEIAMLMPTHLVAAQTGYFIACAITSHEPVIVESVIAMIGAMIPDLDHRDSIVGRAFPFISKSLEYHYGHRTITHSLIAQAIIGTLAILLLPDGYGMAFLAGWLSHSIIDMMTPSGVCWFWPLTIRCVLPGSPKYRISVMSKGELLFLLAIGMAGFITFNMAKKAGDTGIVTAALGNIGSARQQYDAEKGGNAWELKIRGRDNSTYEDVAGQYSVIGDWGESGFMLAAEDRVVTACQSSTCNWYTDHAVLVRGKPEQTTVRRIEAHQTTAQALKKEIAQLGKHAQIFILGSLRALRAEENLPVMKVSGEVVTFSYAQPSDLTGLNGTVTKVRLIIQTRHEPDKVIPEVTQVEKGKRERHPLLEKWIDFHQ